MRPSCRFRLRADKEVESGLAAIRAFRIAVKSLKANHRLILFVEVAYGEIKRQTTHVEAFRK